MAQPWDAVKRRQVKAKLDKEIGRMKAKTGAVTIAVIAFFDEHTGAPLIMMEAGSAPMASGDLYAALAQLYVDQAAKLQAAAKGQPKPNTPEPQGVQ